MANTLKDNQSNVICGLGTFTHTTANDGMYFVACSTSENPTSGITLTISQSGSTTASVSSTTPTAAQQTINLQKVFNCAQGDTLTVQISSSTPIDTEKNTVKSIVTIHRGSA